jgi:hypothetical protein
VEVLLPKLADYGVATLAVGAMALVFVRIVNGLTRAWSTEMTADREQRGRETTALIRQVDRVGDRVNGLHEKLDRLTGSGQ